MTPMPFGRKHPTPLVLASLSVGALWIAALLQLYGMNPCVMCIHVRLMLVAMVLWCLLWWHGSLRAPAWLNRALAVGPLALSAGVGYTGFKLMHADPAACAMTAPSWLEAQAEALWPWFFAPTGICGDPAIWLGIDLSTWTVALAVALGLLSAWALWAGKPATPSFGSRA